MADSLTESRYRASRVLPTTEMREVWAVAWPLVLTNMLNVLVGIVDFKMVGTLGVSSIAAVGMARQVMMFIMVLMIAISGGSSVLVAHAYGAGDKRRVGEVAAKAVTFMCLGAVFVVMPLGLGSSRLLLQALGASGNVVDLGSSYLLVLFGGSLFSMFNFAVIGVLLGVGKTRISLVLLLVVNLLNVLLNYILIFGVGPVPPFGAPGAAMGTILARAVGSVAGLWILTSRRFPIQARWREGFTFDIPLLKRILFLGGPRSLQGIVRNFSRLMTIRIITLLPDSTRAVSAYSVGMQVKMVSTFVGLAFMSAAMSRVGQNLGAEKPDMAERSGWIAAAMATGLMSVAAVVLLVFPGQIMNFFTDDRDVIALGRTFFLIVALTEPVMASAFAFGGALRGGGDPISPFVYASISDLGVVILAGYLFAIVFGMGFTGIALALALSAFTRAIPSLWRFKQGHWKANRLQ